MWLSLELRPERSRWRRGFRSTWRQGGRFLRRILVLISLPVCLAAAVPGPQEADAVYPGATWDVAAPEALGLNPRPLPAITQLMQRALANGVLVRRGRIVAEWTFAGPPEQRVEVQSITKSITGLALGLALKEGRIPSLHARVQAYYPGFEVGPHTAEITFWHLVTATSGIAAKSYRENYLDPANMPPGLESRYHNDHTAELARALTYVFGEPLSEVIRRRVLARIGADVEWRTIQSVRLADDREVPVVAGFAFSRWTARDLARVGWLYVNGGRWRGEQLVPASYVAQCLTPVSVPVVPYRRAGQGKDDMSKSRYGLAWRAGYTEDGRLWWYMSGNGGQFCLVLPEHGIVFTKVNGIGKENQPYVGLEAFEPLLRQLVQGE